jgi:hypothetical protein
MTWAGTRDIHSKFQSGNIKAADGLGGIRFVHGMIALKVLLK